MNFSAKLEWITTDLSIQESKVIVWAAFGGGAANSSISFPFELEPATIDFSTIVNNCQDHRHLQSTYRQTEVPAAESECRTF